MCISEERGKRAKKHILKTYRGQKLASTAVKLARSGVMSDPLRVRSQTYRSGLTSLPHPTITSPSASPQQDPSICYPFSWFIHNISSISPSHLTTHTGSIGIMHTTSLTTHTPHAPPQPHPTTWKPHLTTPALT